MALYARRLEKNRFVWPTPADGVVGICPHQPFDMMQSAGRAPGQHVMPNSPGAVGSVADHKTGSHTRPSALNREMAVEPGLVEAF